MRFNKKIKTSLHLLAVFCLLLLQACGSNFSGSASKVSLTASSPLYFSGTSYSSVGSFTSNTMSVTVNGANCGTNAEAYANFPCVSVTVCGIGTPTNCQTIDDILLDTGSYGLRIFKSALSSSVLNDLAPVTNGSSTLGECVLFGDGSSEWGQVSYAYVQLAGEPKIAAPIQVIDFNFNSPPSPCTSANSSPDLSPNDTGFNGILGVGYLAEDCGITCTFFPSNGQYYTCTGGDCSGGARVDLNAQVTNPIALLPTDNNGLYLTLPSVGSTGAVSATGTLTIGIGTQGAIPTSPTTLQISDKLGVFSTNSGSTYDSNGANRMPGFVDSGSNMLFFPGNLDDCGDVYNTSQLSGLFCPSTDQVLTYANTSISDTTTTAAVTFTVTDFVNVVSTNSSHYVFSNIAGSSGDLIDGMFDWGLPFYFGRTVYVGIDQTTSTLGTGPYFAY
jgi:hypothetical protein